MIFASHILQVSVITRWIRMSSEDPFLEPVVKAEGGCKCRCDDVTAEKKVSINGACMISRITR